MIYIVEGADGTGKSTLANKIAEVKKASVLHSYFDKTWEIWDHHRDMLDAAEKVAKWRPVVLDRWAHSELVYGSVFRNGPSYPIEFMISSIKEPENVIWIYCRNDNAVKNHLKNAKQRSEMFDDMTKVVEKFEAVIDAENDRAWVTYDFDKVNVTKFVEDLPGENFNK